MKKRDSYLIVTTACVCGLLACGADDGESLSADPSVATSGSGTGGSGGATSSSATTSSSDAATSSASSSSSSGTGGNSAAGFVSGSRLRARFIEGGDGSKQFVGFHDSDKGVNCTFRRSNINETRCFPEVSVAYFASLSSNTRYSDSSCTVAAPRVPNCLPPTPAYVSVISCGDSVHSTWQVSGEVNGYAAGTGSCYLTEDKVYLATEVPTSDWEPGAEMVE